jgi:hypothetical protein
VPGGRVQPAIVKRVDEMGQIALEQRGLGGVHKSPSPKIKESHIARDGRTPQCPFCIAD